MNLFIFLFMLGGVGSIIFVMVMLFAPSPPAKPAAHSSSFHPEYDIPKLPVANPRGFYTKLRGVNPTDDESGYRQHLIEKLAPGEILGFCFYPHSGSIGVFNSSGHQVGFISVQIQKELRDTLSRGGILRGCVTDVTGQDKDVLGCNVYVECIHDGIAVIPLSKLQKGQVDSIDLG